MGIITATLGLDKTKKLLASRKGGIVSQQRRLARSDWRITEAIKRSGPLRATEIAFAAGYKGWRGIKKKLPRMVARGLLVKVGRYYKLPEQKDEKMQNIIKRDLEEEFKRDDEARADGREFKPLGHDCDRASWEKLRLAINKETT